MTQTHLQEMNTPSILLIQGPNMSYLGKREPDIYGTTTAAELDQICLDHARGRGFRLEIFYTHSESAAIERIYAAEEQGIQGIVMNPATFSRNGYAIASCLRAVPLRYVEVHMSNIDKRGVHSLLAAVADGVVHGFGIRSYLLGLDAMHGLLQNEPMQRPAQ